MRENTLPESYFTRLDDSSDHEFYNEPRKVVHIDGPAIAALENYYARHVPAHGIYLDMMSSWRSHIPPSLDPISVVGLGMNAEEMDDNPQLDEFIIHDLNVTPMLPYPDNRYDAVMCAVSVQYLKHPVKVFKDVYRVLKPEGIFIVSFSNRYFPTKTVSVFMNSSDDELIDLVQQYYVLAGGFINIKHKKVTPAVGDPLYIVSGIKYAEDI